MRSAVSRSRVGPRHGHQHVARAHAVAVRATVPARSRPRRDHARTPPRRPAARPPRRPPGRRSRRSRPARPAMVADAGHVRTAGQVLGQGRGATSAPRRRAGSRPGRAPARPSSSACAASVAALARRLVPRHRCSALVGQGHDQVAAPVRVVPVGEVLPPVRAAGLLAREPPRRPATVATVMQVGGLPGLGARLGGSTGVRAAARRGLRSASRRLRSAAQHARRRRSSAAGRCGRAPASTSAGRPRSTGVRGSRLRRAAAGARVGGDPLGEHQALQQRVGGQPVRAVHAGAGDLAAGVQAGHGGAAVQVGAHAAAGVVGGGGDRDQARSPGRCRARGRRPGSSGSAARHISSPKCAGVEPDVVGARSRASAA